MSRSMLDSGRWILDDSGFWMISRYFRMSEAETLRTWSVVSTLISVVGFAIASQVGFVDVSEHRLQSNGLPIAAILIGGLLISHSNQYP